MASIGSPNIWAGGFLLLLLLLSLGLTPRSSETPQASALAAAQQSWRQLMATVMAEGEQALHPGEAGAELRAAGDTLGMRYPGLWQSLEQPLRHQFQLVALSNDPDTKRQLLAPLQSHEDPQVRHRAWLEVARLGLRQADYAAVAMALDQALQQPVPERWQADTHLMRALLHLEARQRDAAGRELDQAVTLDGGYWDARQLRLRVYSEALSVPGQTASECLRRSQRLLEDLGALPALADSHDQFRLLADRFAALGEQGHLAFGLLAGLAYQWVGDVSAARRMLDAALSTRTRLPAACVAELSQSARQVLAALPP